MKPKKKVYKGKMIKKEGGNYLTKEEGKALLKVGRGMKPEHTISELNKIRKFNTSFESPEVQKAVKSAQTKISNFVKKGMVRYKTNKRVGI